jgi:hypothetical protein
VITAERLRELLAYDPTSGGFAWRVDRGGLAKAGQIAGSRNGIGYVNIRVDGRDYSAHRLAWLHVTGAWPAGQIDHINGVRDDNRIANLREATNAQNQWNRAHQGSVSGFKGVKWCKIQRKWRAELRKDGRKIHLGRFATAEEAHAAYCAAASEHFGEFARVE